ncbi:MAG: PorT family protein [Prevotella sp.]|nr:PorT family protein [Prevotella sp.]
MTMNAQNGFGLMGGVNTSTSSADDAKPRVGAFIGGLYDFRMNDWFYLQPRLILSYQENQREWNNTLAAPHVKIDNEFYSQWNLSLPVLASFRFKLSDDMGLRLNVGPYIQYALGGKEQKPIFYNSLDPTIPNVPARMSEKGNWDLVTGDKITYGGQIGLQYDYKNWFATLDYKRSFHRSILNMDGFENTLQLGIGYKF